MAHGHAAYSHQRHGTTPANASTAGDTMAMKVVLQLPPRLSSRMRVSLESLGRAGRWQQSRVSRAVQHTCAGSCRL